MIFIWRCLNILHVSGEIFRVTRLDYNFVPPSFLVVSIKVQGIDSYESRHLNPKSNP